jgi:transcriptional regulator with XRE-family HTH domain
VGVGAASAGNADDERDGLVQRLIKWRKDNKLTQGGVADAFERVGVPIDVRTIQQWEQGRYKPSRLAAAALEKFLAEPPTITDAPPYGKQSKLTAVDLAEIRRLRHEGETMKAIGERFGVDEAYISRICSGKQVVKTAA